MKINNAILILVFSVFSINTLNAQDFNYHLGSTSNMVINPAFTGKLSSRLGGLAYWRTEISQQSRNGIFERNRYISTDLYSNRLGAGIGFLFNDYSIKGDMIRLQGAKISYNYFLCVNRKIKLNFALQVGVEKKQVNYKALRLFMTNPQFKQILPVYYDSMLNKDPEYFGTISPVISFGALFSHYKYQVGFSAFAINQPNWAFSEPLTQKRSMQLNVQANYNLYNKSNSEFNIISQFSVMGKQNIIQIGGQYRKKRWVYSAIMYEEFGKFRQMRSLSCGIACHLGIIKLHYTFDIPLIREMSFGHSVSIRLNILQSKFLPCSSIIRNKNFPEI